MPTLQFKGKNIIWNHHLAIPYHTLDEVNKLDYKPNLSKGNLIIEGDNLLALKALVPIYGNKVKCIYIDPPYNTGIEGWVYNDKVNSPMIKEWLGKHVAKDDLTRHDKWLCMITPRLKLLNELLSDDGIILISISDVEFNHLKTLLNEIFGEENFVNVFAWQSRTSKQNDTDISENHEYILAYARNRRQENRRLNEKNIDKWYGIKQFAYFPLPLDPSKFSNPDNDKRGNWKPDPFDAPNIRKNLNYKIINPNTKVVYSPPEGRHWRTEEDNFKKLLKDKRIVFGVDGKAGPQLKVFYNEKKIYGEVDTTWWTGSEKGTTTSATKMLQQLFKGKKVFEYPKPIEMIKALIKICCLKDDIILDSFAGSGSTAHAVLDLNSEDKGNRKFILVQMKEDTKDEPNKNLCKDITRERIIRSIEKYGYKAGFKYYKVGTAIDTESMLSGKLPTYKQFAKYVYYLCTGENLSKETNINEKEFFVGEHNDSVIYLLYSQEYDKLTKLALKLEFAETIRKKYPRKRIFVYAPACFLDDEFLQEKQIQFVNIPYNLFEKN